MDSKRVGTSANSFVPSYFPDDFSIMEHEVKFYREFVYIEMLSSFFLEVGVFKIYEFFRILEEAWLKNSFGIP